MNFLQVFAAEEARKQESISTNALESSEVLPAELGKPKNYALKIDRK